MTTTDQRPTGHRDEDPTPGTVEPHAVEPDAKEYLSGEAASRSTALVMLLGGLAGGTAALTLLLDKLALLVDPTYVPSCSVDAVLSCGSIMNSAQAEVLGFPNPIIGLGTFPVVAAIGALALSRTRLPGWCWTALQVGAVAALGFVAWLITQSVAVIGALCPWCMLVWAVTITIFWHVTAHNLAHGRLELGRAGHVVARHPAVATAVTLAVVLAVLVASFPAWFAAPFAG